MECKLAQTGEQRKNVGNICERELICNTSPSFCLLNKTFNFKRNMATDTDQLYTNHISGRYLQQWAQIFKNNLALRYRKTVLNDDITH